MYSTAWISCTTSSAPASPTRPSTPTPTSPPTSRPPATGPAPRRTASARSRTRLSATSSRASPPRTPRWRSAPLVLVHTLLVPGAGHDGSLPRDAESSAVITAVSRVLEVHPGPFRCCVDLTIGYMDAHLDLQTPPRRGPPPPPPPPPPQQLPGAPPAIFSLASVRCLHLGLWRFPNTADLPRGALRELTLGCVVMEDRDLDFVLARSPVLETLVLYSSQKQVNLRIVSSSLRCVQLCTCIVEDVAVVEAPHLERLFLWETIRCVPGDRVRTRIKFGHGSNLRSVGFLVPGVHVLEVGDTVIKVPCSCSSSIYLSNS
ncbi:hypothetical protein SEVIR_5G233201v4 [Setaria viridis]